MKIAIVTALCGNREQLHNPTVVHENVDYHAFVDNDFPQATVWNKHPLLHFSSDGRFAGRRNAKIYKIMPNLFLPGYDYYFWVDVSHDVVANPFEVCETYLKNSDIALFRHTERNCIYDEAKLLKELNYDHHENIDRQIELYKNKNYPVQNGLYELPVSIRKNTHAISLLNIKWWENICRYSSRDQLSMPFCLWECGIVPTILPGFANGYNKHGGIGNNDIMPQTRMHVGSG
jgi:hypothetical protein